MSQPEFLVHTFPGDVSFYNSTASSWTLATPRTTWESIIKIIHLWGDLTDISAGADTISPVAAGLIAAVGFAVGVAVVAVIATIAMAIAYRRNAQDTDAYARLVPSVSLRA